MFTVVGHHGDGQQQHAQVPDGGVSGDGAARGAGEQAGASAQAGSGSLLDAIVREGAQKMLAAALQAEVAAYIEAHAGERDEAGHRLVVRNGSAAQREVLTSAGSVGVRAPRVDDRRIDEETGARVWFSSAILPAWARKSPQVTEVLPLLYLHGLSTSDFAPALSQFLGSSAGLSASVIQWLTTAWQGEQVAFRPGPLRHGLRLRLSRRGARQHLSGVRAVVPAGAHRGARRRA